MARIVQVMDSVIAPSGSAFVILAGLALDVTSQTALEHQTVLTVDTAILPTASRQNVLTVSGAGWGQLVTTLVSTDTQKMGCANVILAIPTKDVTVSVQAMASALKDNIVGATQFPAVPIVDPIASFLDALVTMETVMAEASVISSYNVASAMLDGRATPVMNRTAQGLPGVLVTGNVVRPCPEGAIVTGAGLVRPVKCLASMVLIMAMHRVACVGRVMLVLVATWNALEMEDASMGTASVMFRKASREKSATFPAAQGGL